jgi:hypothetical protein
MIIVDEIKLGRLRWRSNRHIVLLSSHDVRKTLLHRPRCLNIVKFSHDRLVMAGVAPERYVIIALRVLAHIVTLWNLALLVMQPLLVSLSASFPEFNLFLDVNIPHLEFDSTHLDDLISFEEVVLLCSILDLLEVHGDIHALLHLVRRQAGLPRLLVEIIHIFERVCRQNTFDEVFVPNFGHFEYLLELFSKLLADICAGGNKDKSVIVADAYLAIVYSIGFFCCLTQIVVEKTVRVFVPLESFHNKLLILKLIGDLIF